MTQTEIESEVKPLLPMPVKAKPYRHQIEAFNLAMRLFGIAADKKADCTNKQDVNHTGGQT